MTDDSRHPVSGWEPSAYGDLNAYKGGKKVNRYLHVACGPAKHENVPVASFKDWQEIRCDIDDDYDVDVIADMRTLQGVETASFEGLYCSHALEHLHLYDVPKALGSFFRVLKPHGACCVMVPNFEGACRFIASGNGGMFYDSPAGPIYAHEVIFGKENWNYTNEFMRHRCGLTPDLLRGLILGVGFRVNNLQVDEQNIFIVGEKP